MSDVDFLVKLRDAAQMIADAANEYIETKNPYPEWDAGKVQWSAAEGPKGPYERADRQDSGDFRTLTEDLKAHGGNLSRDNFYYWLFQDDGVVGRKLIKQR